MTGSECYAAVFYVVAVGWCCVKKQKEPGGKSTVI